MNWIKKSIRSKIIITVFVCIIVFALIAAPSILLTISSIHERSIKSQAESVSRGGENLLISSKSNALNHASNVSRNTELAQNIQINNITKLSNIVNSEKEMLGFDFITIIDKSGSVLMTSLNDSSKINDLKNISIVTAAQGGTASSNIEVLSDSMLTICAAAPIYGLDNSMLGIVMCGYNLSGSTFTKEMNTIFKVDSGIFFNDKLISSTPLHNELLLGNSLSNSKLVNSKSETLIFKEKFNGKTVQSVYVPILDNNNNVKGFFYNGIDRTHDDRVVLTFMSILILGICVLCGIALWMIDIVVKSISKRINSMVLYADDISTGNMSETICIQGKDEVARLGTAFVNMIDGIKNQISVVEKMSHGDFSVEIPIRSEKDIMGKSLEKMLNNLNDMLEKISETTQNVSDGSLKLSDGANDLAKASSMQAEAVEILSDNIHNISQIIEQNDIKMAEAVSSTSNIQTMAEEGMTKMSELNNAVMDIDKSSEEIQKIMMVIEDIAFQTNILALNASIEASHAGEAGKGFAVVAQEVQTLAEKSTESAKETSSLIMNTVKKAKLGTSISSKTSEYFGEIVSGIEESNSIINQASQQAKTQAGLISDIDSGINNVSNIVKQNESTANQSAESSMAMNDQAEILNDLVSKFKHN